MIPLKEIIEKLKLEPVSSTPSVDRPVAGGYASDLLSCAIKGAKKDSVWVTLQSHLNVVAVASLLGLAGVIITEGNRPDQETLAPRGKRRGGPDGHAQGDIHCRRGTDIPGDKGKRRRLRPKPR